MLHSWKLGRAFGINVYVHPTFLILPLLVIAGSYTAGIGTVAYLLALVTAVFGCVLLHEFGHALMARVYGVPTLDITLYPIGGVARLGRLPERPGEELAIAVAGPAVNVVIAILLTPLLVVGARRGAFTAGGPDLMLITSGWPVVFHFLAGLWFSNVALVLFNMLPTFPMDGGRVLRALLAFRLSLVRATEIAVWVGRAVALAGVAALFVFVPGVFASNPMLLVIALFILLAGQYELSAVRQREEERREAETMVLPVLRPYHAEPVDDAVPPGFSGITWDHRSGVGVHWLNGRPVSTFQVPLE